MQKKRGVEFRATCPVNDGLRSVGLNAMKK